MSKYIFILFILFAPAFSYGAIGTIDSANKYAKICHDTSCTSYGVLNMRPTINASTTGATAITITDTVITGHAWGSEIGWVNFAPIGNGVEVNAETGELSGKAWSNVGSWINFSPTGGGVTINSDGEFEGYAWVSGFYGGWLKFDCNDLDACVTTDWRPTAGGEEEEEDSGGGSSGGSRIGRNDPDTTDTLPLEPSFSGVNNYDVDNDTSPDVGPGMETEKLSPIEQTGDEETDSSPDDFGILSDWEWPKVFKWVGSIVLGLTIVLLIMRKLIFKV